MSLKVLIFVLIMGYYGANALKCWECFDSNSCMFLPNNKETVCEEGATECGSVVYKKNKYGAKTFLVTNQCLTEDQDFCTEQDSNNENLMLGCRICEGDLCNNIPISPPY